MKDQPLYHANIIDLCNGFVDNLTVCLRLTEICFEYLPYKKKEPLAISLTYYYSETQVFPTIDDLAKELKRCILYQRSEHGQINISAELTFDQKIVVDDEEIDLFYYGRIMLYDSAGFVYFNWYGGTPTVQVTLYHKIEAEGMLDLYSNVHDAIPDQLKKNNTP